MVVKSEALGIVGTGGVETLRDGVRGVTSGIETIVSAEGGNISIVSIGMISWARGDVGFDSDGEEWTLISVITTDAWVVSSFAGVLQPSRKLDVVRRLSFAPSFRNSSILSSASLATCAHLSSSERVRSRNVSRKSMTSPRFSRRWLATINP